MKILYIFNMLVTKNKLTEAIHAVLNYDNVQVDIQEREYDEEEIEKIGRASCRERVFLTV